METKKILVLMFIITLVACKENKPLSQENKPTTRDVLFPRTTSYYGKGMVDSMALEYTNIDNTTQFVKRIFYTKAFKPDTIKYKLINDRTRAYIEYPFETIRSLYLDTETFDTVWRNFKDLTQDIVPSSISLSLDFGGLQFINSVKDTINSTTYYVFKGGDIAFFDEANSNRYFFYFDSIFHLKKVYDKDKNILLSVVN